MSQQAFKPELMAESTVVRHTDLPNGGNAIFARRQDYTTELYYCITDVA